MAGGNEVQITVTSRNKTKAGFDAAEKGARGLKGTLQQVGATAAGFLAANVVSAGFAKFQGFIHDSVKAASNLEQAVGGTTAVFGPASDVIARFGKTAAEQAGLSEEAFRRLTTATGGSLKRMTGDVDFAAESSVRLAQIGADLAATYGGTAAEAMDAFAAAMRGEADPAERFNLDLRASAVAAKAVEMGLAKSTSKVNESARAKALMALITEQAADAEGQFAREAGTAAGQQERSKAAAENLQAALGAKLMPVTLALTRAKLALVAVMADKVLPAMMAIGGWIDKNRALVGTLAAVVGGVLVAAFVAWAASATAAAAATIAATWPVIAIGAAIGLLAAGFVKAWKSSEKFRVVVATVLKIVGQAFLRYVDIWLMGFEKVFSILGKLPGKAGAAFRAAEKATQMARQKVADYHRSLEGLPAKVRTQVQVFSDDAMARIRRVNRELASIPAYKLTRIKVEQAYGMSIGALKRAAGGPIGAVAAAASGGARGSMTLVGEQGPELVRLPFGSMVKPAGATRSMLGGGGEQRIVLEIHSGGSRHDDYLVEVLRKAVRARGGSVQTVLGR